MAPHLHPHVHAGHVDEENSHWHPGLGSVLDIGGEVGALILYTDPDYEGAEIEVSREGESRRTHTAIHGRRVGQVTVFAGVYPDLVAGHYRIWVDDPSLPDEITIVGGEVAELDWRR